MIKERDSVRSKSFLKATIRFQSGNATVDCVVRNISLSGARLEISPTFTLPTEFELEIPQRGVIFQCALKWRRDDAAGIRFKDCDLPAVTVPAQSGVAMDALRQENLRLRQEIAGLRARLQEFEGVPASIPVDKLNASNDE